MERINKHKLKNGMADVEKKPVCSDAENERAELLAEAFDLLLRLTPEQLEKVMEGLI